MGGVSAGDERESWRTLHRCASCADPTQSSRRSQKRSLSINLCHCSNDYALCPKQSCAHGSTRWQCTVQTSFTTSLTQGYVCTWSTVGRGNGIEERWRRRHNIRGSSAPNVAPLLPRLGPTSSRSSRRVAGLRGGSRWAQALAGRSFRLRQKCHRQIMQCGLNEG